MVKPQMKNPALKGKPQQHKAVRQFNRTPDRLSVAQLAKHLVENATHSSIVAEYQN